jgi:hypothetical protein
LVMQLGGVVAVEITGGLEVPFHPGREVCWTGLDNYCCFIFIRFRFR